MKLANLGGRIHFVRDGQVLDVTAAAAGIGDGAVESVFAQWDDLLAAWPRADWTAARPLPEDELLAPVPRPAQVFAVALNYRPHAAEAGFQAPDSPLVFTKFPSCLTGPRATVELPPGHVDWEAELVAVIGKPAFRVPATRAWEHVAGLTIGQDLSERVLQSAGKPAQFSLGKSYPGFGPVGPWLVSRDEFADPDNLEIGCELSGEPMQHDRTSSMIFPIPVLVEFLSGICPLYPGDLIFTGTPSGVGNRRTPQRFIGPDDVLVTTIEGLGSMRQTFTAQR